MADRANAARTDRDQNISGKAFKWFNKARWIRRQTKIQLKGDGHLHSTIELERFYAEHERERIKAGVRIAQLSMILNVLEPAASGLGRISPFRGRGPIQREEVAKPLGDTFLDAVDRHLSEHYGDHDLISAPELAAILDRARYSLPEFEQRLAALEEIEDQGKFDTFLGAIDEMSDEQLKLMVQMADDLEVITRVVMLAEWVVAEVGSRAHNSNSYYKVRFENIGDLSATGKRQQEEVNDLYERAQRGLHASPDWSRIHRNCIEAWNEIKLLYRSALGGAEPVLGYNNGKRDNAAMSHSADKLSFARQRIIVESKPVYRALTYMPDLLSSADWEMSITERAELTSSLMPKE